MPVLWAPKRLTSQFAFDLLKRAMRSSEKSFITLLILLVVSNLVRGASVTIITHGLAEFNTYPSWLDSMGTAIANRAGGSTAVIYAEVGHQVNGSLGVTAFTLKSGILPTPSSTNGEIVIKLFWHTVAGPTDANPLLSNISTTDIANSIFPYLTNTITWTSGEITQPFCEMPIHLIGHSRGGSLVSELARLLAQQNAWVDQMTTLDPHPLDFLLGNDASVVCYDNVIFADNYWELDDSGFLPANGMHIDGTSEMYLTPILNNDGIDDSTSNDHSEVHAWYQGTIDSSASSIDGVLIPRQYWYTSGDLGFQFSLIANGQSIRKISSASYTGNGLKWTFALRSTTGYTRSGFQWPNVELDNASGFSILQAGKPFTFQVRYQNSLNTNFLKIEFGTDTDRNPYNNRSTNIFLKTTNSADAKFFWYETHTWTPTVSDDRKFLYAKITDYKGYTRYHYLGQPFHVISHPQMEQPRVLNGGAVQLALTGGAGLNYTIQFSTNFVSWSTLTAFTSTNTTTTFFDSLNTNGSRRFYRAIMQ